MSRSVADQFAHPVDLRIERVVMEATSDHWKPVFYPLEAHEGDRGLLPGIRWPPF